MLCYVFFAPIHKTGQLIKHVFCMSMCCACASGPYVSSGQRSCPNCPSGRYQPFTLVIAMCLYFFLRRYIYACYFRVLSLTSMSKSVNWLRIPFPTNDQLQNFKFNMALHERAEKHQPLYVLPISLDELQCRSIRVSEPYYQHQSRVLQLCKRYLL